MKILLKSFFAFVFLVSISEAKTQQRFLPGYIVTVANDTIYGMVKDRKNGMFPKKFRRVRFKSNSFLAKRYNPYQLAGYMQGGVYFESVWLRTRSQFLKTRYESIPFSGRKHFVKVIVRGYLSYYQLEHRDYESRSFDEVDLFKREGDDYFIRVTQGIFGLKKKSLAEYFWDCPELVQKIEDKKLKRPSEIVHYYNNWIQGKD